MPTLPTVTVTGTTGPDSDLTAVPLTEVRRLTFEFDRNIAKVEYGSPLRTIDLTFGTFTGVAFTVAGNQITAAAIT